MTEIFAFRNEFWFLSNFYPCRIFWQNRWWRGSEWAYQAWKTDSVEWQERIRNAPTARLAKHLGRIAPARLGMEDRRIPAMRSILKAKFVRPDLRTALASTGDAYLAEGNRHGDVFWGMVRRDGVWAGENHLGRLLMELRAE